MHGGREELPDLVLGARQGIPHAVPHLAERAHGPAHDQPGVLAVGESIYIIVRYMRIYGKTLSNAVFNNEFSFPSIVEW